MKKEKFLEKLDKKFTEKVADLISKGFTINTETMSGAGREVAKVDFIKDGKIYRLVLLREIEKFDEVYKIVFGYAKLKEEYGTIDNNELKEEYCFEAYWNRRDEE